MICIVCVCVAINRSQVMWLLLLSGGVGAWGTEHLLPHHIRPSLSKWAPSLTYVDSYDHDVESRSINWFPFPFFPDRLPLRLNKLTNQQWPTVPTPSDLSDRSRPDNAMTKNMTNTTKTRILALERTYIVSLVSTFPFLTFDRFHITWICWQANVNFDQANVNFDLSNSVKSLTNRQRHKLCASKQRYLLLLVSLLSILTLRLPPSPCRTVAALLTMVVIAQQTTGRSTTTAQILAPKSR
jgi:hypothetical protein